MSNHNINNHVNSHIDTQSRHITEADGNIFADLGFSDSQAQQLHAESLTQINAELEMKITLMVEITQWIVSNNLKQSAAAEILNISRPRVSDVVNQKTEKFTIDSLVGMLSMTGKRARLVIE
ncbi:XRE family transcriptional regulator [Obesumbacterium proteus]|uniref:helix-turn-helix domain-containing protein n=1 Tax=Obesumbacterium proteus TaxID=82983 RepID=UPI001033DC76|nr:XRE family transcriptional regulator [Obesumbacterium proteus]TBL73722.1 XRE family transcriptional regulator [Obesumbacterium proteus]